MGLLITILLGALVGYFATRVLGRHDGFIVSTLVGIVGAFLGNSVSYLLGQGKVAFLDFSLSGLFFSFLGALLLVYILNAIQNRA